MRRRSDATTPVLPTFEDRWYLLETDGRPTGPLQSLVLDHLLLNDGPVYGVDAAGHARSDALARLAPSERLLKRVRVARGVTAHQHATLVDDGTAMLVLPAVDAMYRGDDLQGAGTDAMLGTTVDRVAAIRREHDVPVVTPCRERDDLTAPVAERVCDVLDGRRADAGRRPEHRPPPGSGGLLRRRRRRRRPDGAGPTRP